MSIFVVPLHFAIAGLATTSCNTDKTQCWKIYVEFQSGQSQEYYFWGSGIESDAQMKIYEQMPDIKTIRKEQTFRSESDCK